MTLQAHTWTSFDEIPASFLLLLEDVERDNFFCGLQWFRNFCRNTVAANANIRIFGIADNGAPATARGLLLTRAPANQAGSYVKDRIPNRGSIASLTDHQSISYAPVIREEDPEYDSIVEALVRAANKSAPQLDLNFMDPASRAYTSLERAMLANKLKVCRYEYRTNVFERVTDVSYEHYLKARPSVVRKNYTRMARKLDRESELRFELLTTVEQAKSAAQLYETVLEKSWKEPEPFPQHASGVIHGAAAAGALRLGLLYVDNEPVAAQVWIVSGGQATIYKTHYNSDFYKKSVGAVLSLRMFEHALDVEHVNVVDYGVGDEAAKTQWLQEQRPIAGLVGFDMRKPWGILGFVQFSLLRLRDQLAERAKPVLQPILQRLKGSD